MGGVLKRDFIFNHFIHYGMNLDVAKALLGEQGWEPQYSSMPAFGYLLPFNQRCAIGYDNFEEQVRFVWTPYPSYPLQGMILPVMVLLLAVVEVGVYFTVRYFQRRKSRT